MAQRELAGPLAAHPLGAGRWQLLVGVDATEVYVQGAGPEAAAAFRNVQRLGLDWHASGVTVWLWGPDGPRRLMVRSALVHRPEPGAYQAVPLATFDAAARKFWRRVFRVLRVPGGRHLLKYLAKRGAGNTKSRAS